MERDPESCLSAGSSPTSAVAASAGPGIPSGDVAPGSREGVTPSAAAPAAVCDPLRLPMLVILLARVSRCLLRILCVKKTNAGGQTLCARVQQHWYLGRGW